MILNGRDRHLCHILRDLPQQYGLRYTKSASQALQRELFYKLVVDNDSYLRTLFKGNVPRAGQDWSLRLAQGMVDGSEYSEAARGKACGHIFKHGDATYHCKTCTDDDTCVLCTRCFEASDHTGHNISSSISNGNSGCCDCGDDEAWRLPVKCAIHTADNSTTAGKQRVPNLPEELVEGIKMTIGRSIDYLCDVIACSPENLRLEKDAETIQRDEEASYLVAKWYEEPQDQDPEFALVLWNDEKHTVDEVKEQVARACKKEMTFGLEKANETDEVGRSVIKYSKDLKQLLKVAKIIEQIKITVTIRSSRDLFREQMCDTIIEWLLDIAGCSVGEEHAILQNTICEELLKTWRPGSTAINRWVGKDGIDDHEVDESAQFSTTVLVTARNRGALARGPYRRTLSGTIRDESDSDTFTNDNDNDDGDDEADDDRDPEQMELDLLSAGMAGASQSMDQDMRAPGELEDETEVSEATYAGYPPPPPPPPHPTHRVRVQGPIRSFSTDSDIAEPLSTSSVIPKPLHDIPETPWLKKKKAPCRPPAYWVEQPEASTLKEALGPYEDLRKHVRLDWLLLFDLRLWKKARIGLRDLFISTVVSVPQFKRVLGLRFAGLYTLLAQLYLIADREPDLSIINLSIQMFTTASIVEENVDRANFLTNLMAILYTFLTHRQVGHPWDVDVQATLAFDAGSVANRRMYFFFNDLKRLFDNAYIREQLRTVERYQLQFLDLIRLPQGTCPNIRAVGDHVEYENDIWIGASLMTKDINKLCRQFAASFQWFDNEANINLRRVIRTVAKATIVNSVGGERFRFDQAEIKTETRFFTKDPFYFESPSGDIRHSVVEFVVETQPISFHHALHYTLSWLIDVAKSMSTEEMKSLLRFNIQELKEPPPYKTVVPDYDPESYLMALFDFPLRVCAWLAQMKAGMWVRNGLSLRHQMGTYRGVSNRDFGHHRDIFLLQTAMVVCNPSRVLASIIDRFGMEQWMRGRYVTRAGHEPSQQLDVAEDFVHLLIVILSDRTSLHPAKESNAQEQALRRDIIHILCFKPLSFSDLNSRLGLADKTSDLEDFQEILEEMTNYRAPEGLSDAGSFELKSEYLADVDPYTAHYGKNQRDEAEQAYRTWMAKRSGKPAEDIVLEPKLRPIKSGVFKNLSSFTATPLFAQIIFYALQHHMSPHLPLETPATRVEAFLQVVLHLALAAILEEAALDEHESELDDHSPSFALNVLQVQSELGITIFDLLVKMLENMDIKACHPKIRLILHRIQQRQPRTYSTVVSSLFTRGTQLPALALDKLGFESPRTPLGGDQDAKERQAREIKKQQALDRQARVMAQFQQQQQNFMNNQDITEWGEDDSEEAASVVAVHAEESKKTWRYPSGNCILCQEETNDSRLFGTFALMSNSSMFRQTDVQDPDFFGEILTSPNSLDRSADAIRPYGVAGQNRKIVHTSKPDGSTAPSEHQILGKGFPPSHAARGPASVGCGHIMHFACFDLYCAATQRRQNHQIARNHPERIDRKEFVCPLCKALGNAFLPIIWRGKEETYPGVLQTETSFDEWLSSGVGLTVSRLLKREEGRHGNNPHEEHFISYTSKAVIPPLASKLTSLFQTHLPSPTSPQGSSRNSMPGRFPLEDSYHPTMISPSHPLSTDVLLIDELVAIYTRIRETITANKLPSRWSTNAGLQGTSMDLGHADTLAKTLGNSIAATEISQRGVQSQPGHTLLDKIPASVMTHLRILSETASSYIAIGGMRNTGTNTPASEFSDTTQNQLLQLFPTHPQIATDEAEYKNRVPSALDQDPFVFLTECSIFVVPAFHLDIHHTVRLCFLLQMVKVALYMLALPDEFAFEMRRVMGPYSESRTSRETLQAFSRFLTQTRRFCNPVLPWPTFKDPNTSADIPINHSPEFLVPLYRVFSAYALTFLRKVAILLNVRYGVDFPDTGFGDMEEPEIERLTKVLNLPTLSALFASVGDTPDSELNIEASMVAGWILHWQWHDGHPVKMRPVQSSLQRQKILIQSAYANLKLEHPCIFELIGLPKQFDALIYEVTKRRCPTTGNRLEDAALCLFCGDFMCSQASCCHKNHKGGCNQHMQKYVNL